MSLNGLLRGARVYLSGPMDFVASRALEKESGWRTRVGQVLASYGVTVFDPWNKPDVRGLHEYGKEGEGTTNERVRWTFEPNDEGARKRAAVAEGFWPALHIDLRMVDTSDFIICYCPTNIYSVGTPHEIFMARAQRKPVLFVSPYVEFPALKHLKSHLAEAKDEEGLALLAALAEEVPIRENPNASPSLWYMPIVGGEHFFDGLGFDDFRTEYGWIDTTSLDANERARKPVKPLLPFLRSLNEKLPHKWDRVLQQMVPNDDWLLWDLRKDARVEDAKR